MTREPRITGIRRLLRLSLSRRAIERDVDDEIRFHLESRVRELTDRGLPPSEARRRAYDEFGDTSEARRELTEVDRRRLARDRRALFLDSLRQDVRYAFRGLRRQPAFTAVVVITLTLGIGANAVVFGLVDRLLLSPPAHVAEPDRVARIFFRERAPAFADRNREYTTHPVTAYPMVDALRDEVPGFADVAAYFRGDYTLGRGVQAREIPVGMADGSFFRLLRVRPAVGRFYTPEEDVVGAAYVAVLGHGFWQEHFGGRAEVLDSIVIVDGQTYDIVGVAPRGFTGVDLDRIDIWVPTTSLAAKNFGDGWRDTPNAMWARAIVRLAPGITVEQAEAQATVAFRRELASWKQSWRDSLGTVVTGSLIAARGPAGPSREASVSLWLMGVSAIVLLIACANIANLLLARAIQRRREIAVRLAMGVGRARLARQLVTEALLLATIAAGVALIVAHWGGQLVRGVLLPTITFAESPVSVRVLLFTLTATVLTGALAGLAPAVQASRTDVSSSLRTGGREGGGRRSPLRSALLVSQAALSVVLLVGAGLFVRSLHNVRNLDVGIDLDRVLLVHMDDLYRRETPRARVEELFRLARERAASLPGVESVALLGGSVPTRTANAIGVRIPGRDSLPDLPGGGPYFAMVGADYFRTIGARVVKGRAVDDADVRMGARVMLVNETIAKHYFPDADPVGQCAMIWRDSVCTRIVGVAQDIMMFGMIEDVRGQVYVPPSHPALARFPGGSMIVRLDARAPISAGGLRRELQSVAPDMPFVGIQSFAELVAPELQPWRLGAMMFGIFGGVALLIAAVGLYSVIAYLVSQRTHEIGVRMALGAARADVVALVMREGIGVALVGLALGVAAALVAGRFVVELLYETSPRDPAILAAVALVLAAVAVAAAMLPSWRASRVDPATALRSE